MARKLAMGLAITNNNPGNLKDPKTGSFRQFQSPQEGYAALLNDLTAKQMGTSTTGIGPGSSLIDFAATYAPKSDNNNPGQYAASLANHMGVRPDARLKDLDVTKWAAAVAKNEDNKSLFGNQKIAGTTPQIGGQGSLLGDVGQSIVKAGTGVSEAMNKGLQGQINPLSSALQGAGAIAGGVGDLTMDVLHHTPVVGSVVRGAEGLVEKGVTAGLNTQTGQNIAQGVSDFSQAHPEAAGNIGAAFDIATAYPILKGVGKAAKVAKGAANTALRGSTDAVVDAVSPKLGPVGSAKALMQRGTETKGLLGQKYLAPDPKAVDIADVVRQNVPKFNPKDLTGSIQKTQTAVDGLKKSLKADVAVEGAGKIYPAKELISRLKNIEKPDLIAADTTLNNVYDKLINRVAGIAKEQGGKVENLPNILSDFDAMVKRQYPNLYKSEALTPLRQGVKDIREEIKTFAEEMMPTVALKERMLTVHKLLTAMENMSKKAVSGVTNEIGTNRFTGKFPVVKGLLKTGVRLGAEGLGIGSALHLLGH